MNFLIIYLVAFAITIIFTPVAILLGKKLGIMDDPKDDRRVHTKAVPRIGGMAIFIGVISAMLLALKLGYATTDIYDSHLVTTENVYGIIIGGTAIYILGTIDDIKGLSPIAKLIGQIGCASIVYAYGIKLNFVSNFMGDYNMAGVVCYVVTVIWVVAITNTINLVDGLDGLAAGIVAIASICIAYVAYIWGYYPASVLVLAVSGGCLGFLPFNFYPAKIFMGDGGSLFLGFMIATLSLLQPIKSTTMVAVLIPVLVLSLPIFDTIFAIIRRLVNGKSIMVADKGHLHHRLMSTGMGQRRTVLCMYGICGIMGTAAVLFSRELYVETIGLVAVAAMYVYIVLTDTNRKVPKILEKD